MEQIKNRTIYRVKGLLTSREMSMTTLASLTGIEKSHLSRMLNGKANITQKTINKIAEVFDVTPEYVEGTSNDATPQSFKWALSDLVNEDKDELGRMQAIENFKLINYISTMGVNIMMKVTVKEQTYMLNKKGMFIALDEDGACLDDSYDLNEYEMLQKINKFHQDSRIYYELNYYNQAHTVKEIDYHDFCVVLRNLRLQIQLNLNIIFNSAIPVNNEIALTPFDLALAGELEYDSEFDTDRELTEHEKELWEKTLASMGHFVNSSDDKDSE